MYEKTTCQFQIKFISEDYLQVYKTVNLFTNTFTFNTNKFASIKVIKNTCVQTQVIKNTNVFKSWIKLKLFIDMGQMK
jgi:hypothetical protein